MSPPQKVDPCRSVTDGGPSLSLKSGTPLTLKWAQRPPQKRDLGADRRLTGSHNQMSILAAWEALLAAAWLQRGEAYRTGVMPLNSLLLLRDFLLNSAEGQPSRQGTAKGGRCSALAAPVCPSVPALRVLLGPCKQAVVVPGDVASPRQASSPPDGMKERRMSTPTFTPRSGALRRGTCMGTCSHWAVAVAVLPIFYVWMNEC